MAEKCPQYTVKWPYECLIDILCGDNETEVIQDSHPERRILVVGKGGHTRGWGHLNDDIKC